MSSALPPSVEMGIASGGPNEMGGSVAVGVCCGVSKLMSFSNCKWEREEEIKKERKLMALVEGQL